MAPKHAVEPEWPKAMTMTDHLGRTLTYSATDQADFDAHVQAGWSAPYAHQKFPMAVHGKKTTLTVNSEDELAAAIAKGYSETPVIDEQADEI